MCASTEALSESQRAIAVTSPGYMVRWADEDGRARSWEERSAKMEGRGNDTGQGAKSHLASR